MKNVRIAVAGAGLIGMEHIRCIQATEGAELIAIVDPSSAAEHKAHELGVAHFTELKDLLSAGLAEGVVLATPNNLHAEQTRQCIEAGLASLVEKPVSSDIESARALVDFYRIKGGDVPVLVGHHRSYSGVMQAASNQISRGELGRLVAIQGSALFYKPAHYFREGKWRTKKGGGPILLNLIHEIGNLRQLCGEIRSVSAITSNSIRNFEVEDTCAIALEFESGALGTFILSDTAASPKSWEQTSGENRSYAHYPLESCYHITGTQGSLSVPSMKRYRYSANTDPSWWNQFEQSNIEFDEVDPLIEQMKSFVAVINGEEAPRVSLLDGYMNLLVIEAVMESAKTSRPVLIDPVALALNA